MLADFYKKYFLFCLGLFLLGVYPVLQKSDLTQAAIFLNFILFAALTFVSAVVILGSVGKNNSNISTMVMASMLLKLIFALIYFYITYQFFKDRVMIFVGSFFVAYILFIVFEITYIVWFIKKNNN